jgi:hypothetical protein
MTFDAVSDQQRSDGRFKMIRRRVFLPKGHNTAARETTNRYEPKNSCDNKQHRLEMAHMFEHLTKPGPVWLQTDLRSLDSSIAIIA